MESGTIVGRALKTIYSRILSMSGAQDALASVGISIKDSFGNVRQVADILDELGGKWQSLSKEQQQYIALEISGRDQLTRGLALLNNYSTAVKATETALNSSNSAMQEQEKFEQSLEARTNKLRTAWTELSTAVGDAVLTDSLILTVEGLRDLAQFGTKVADTVGVLPVVLGGLSSALMFLSGNFRKAVVDMNIFKAGLTGVGIAANTTKVALRGLLASTVVGAVFVAIGFAIEKTIGAIAKYNEKQKEIEEMQNKSTESISTQSEKIDQLANKYEKLSKIQNKTKEQEDEYIRIKNELAQLLPIVSSGLDSNGNSVISESDALKKNIELLKEKAEYEKLLATQKAPKELDTMNAELTFNKADLKDIQRQIANMESQEEFNPLSERYLNLKLKENKIQQDINQLEQDRIGLFKNLIIQNEKLTENDQNWLGSLVVDGKKSVEEMQQLAKDMSNVRFVTGEMFSTDEIEKFSNEQKSVFESMANSAKNGYTNWQEYEDILIKVGVQATKVKEIIKNLSEGKITPEDAEEQMQALQEATEEQQKALDNAYSSISNINKILEDYQENNSLSADSINEIVREYPQLMKYMNDEEELIKQLQIERDREAEIVKASAYEKVKASEFFYQSSISLLQQQLKEQGVAYNGDLSNFKSLAEAKLAIEKQLLTNLAMAWKDYVAGTSVGANWGSLGTFQKDGTYKVTESGAKFFQDKNNAEAFVNLYNQRKAQQEALDKAMKNVSSVGLNLNKIGLSSSGSKDKKSGSKDKDEAKIQDVTEAIINQINAESRLAEAKNKTTKEQIDEISSQQKYREQIELTNKLISGQEDEINKLTKANNNLHLEAEKVRGKTKSDTYKWFDDELNPSLAFEQLKNSLKTGTAQEELQKLFDSLQKIKLAHRDNSQAIQDLTKSTKEYKQELNNLQLTAMKYEYDQQLDDIDFLIEKQDILMSSLDENSSEYSNAVLENNKLIQQKIALTEQEIQKTLDLMSIQKADSLIMGELKERYEDLVIAQLQYEQQLKQQKREVANEIISIMKETYEKQKDLALDAIDEELDALEKAHDRKIEMIDEENDRIQESIDLKRKQIEQEESERDFTKDREKLQKQLQDVQNRISIQKLDDSDESQAKVLEMEKEKADILEQLDELQHDRQIELRQNNLDELSDDFKKEYDQKKKLEDDKYNKEKESIEKRKKLQEEYYDNLINNEREFARIREEIMDGNLSNIENQLGEFKDYIQNNMSSIGDSISQNLIDKIAQAEEQLKNFNSMSANIPSSSPSSNNNGSNNNNNTSEQDKLPSGWTRGSGGSLFTKDGSISYGVDENGYVYKNGNFVPAENYKYIPQEVIDMAKKRKMGIYHTGGIVGGEGTKETKLLNSLFQVKPNEEIAKLLKGDEFVVNSKLAMPNFINNMQNMLSGFKPQLAGIPTGDNYEINLNIKEFSGTKKEAESTAKTIMDILKRRGK